MVSVVCVTVTVQVILLEPEEMLTVVVPGANELMTIRWLNEEPDCTRLVSDRLALRILLSPTEMVTGALFISPE